MRKRPRCGRSNLVAATDGPWKISNDRSLVGVREPDLLRAAKLDGAWNYHSVCAVQETGKYQADNQKIRKYRHEQRFSGCRQRHANFDRIRPKVRLHHLTWQRIAITTGVNERLLKINTGQLLKSPRYPSQFGLIVPTYNQDIQKTDTTVPPSGIPLGACRAGSIRCSRQSNFERKQQNPPNRSSMLTFRMRSTNLSVQKKVSLRWRKMRIGSRTISTGPSGRRTSSRRMTGLEVSPKPRSTFFVASARP